MADSRHPLLILYASQTGNAQDVAELIGREAERRFYQPRILAADAYLRSSIAQFPQEQAVVFVVSTTGQGDSPENIIEFWKFLRRKSLPPNSLQSMNIAVFGLGDSGYLKYNIMAKLLYRRLQSLGAAALLPLGLGDDQHPSGYDAALDHWLPQLWTALRSNYPLLPPGFTEPPPTDVSAKIRPKYKAVLLPAVPEDAPKYKSFYAESIAAAAAIDALDAATSGLTTHHNAITDGHPATTSLPASTSNFTAAAPLFTALSSNVRVTAESHFQDVRLLDINLQGSGLWFDPGDIIAVWPQQRSLSLETFYQRCGLDADAWVTIQPCTSGTSGSSDSSNAIDSQDEEIKKGGVVVRVGALIAGVMDIDGAIPRRVFFQALAQNCPPGRHAERLAHFASPKGRDDCHEYCRKEGRTVLEILTDFQDANLSLEWLLSYCPRLRPRRFSVASSLALKPNKAELLVAVVEWTTPGRRKRRGLCSNWLANLQPGETIAAWSEAGALHMPPSMDIPMILVGPGTGVAPFRSFLEHRAAASAQQQSGSNGTSANSSVAPAVLVFGCRNEQGDYYCKEEWAQMVDQGVLKKVLTAFSRDTPKKVYVQHRIKEHGAEIWELIESGAAIYVAGSADKMPADVEAAFRAVAVEHGGLTSEEAEKLFKRMEALKRYQVECWS